MCPEPIERSEFGGTVLSVCTWIRKVTSAVWAPAMLRMVTFRKHSRVIDAFEGSLVCTPVQFGYMLQAWLGQKAYILP